MAVLSFDQAYERRHGPDAEHVWRAPDGREFQRFLCDFSHDGDEYSFDIWALDREDAERRVASLKASASLAGQVFVAGTF